MHWSIYGLFLFCNFYFVLQYQASKYLEFFFDQLAPRSQGEILLKDLWGQDWVRNYIFDQLVPLSAGDCRDSLIKGLNEELDIRSLTILFLGVRRYSHKGLIMLLLRIHYRYWKEIAVVTHFVFPSWEDIWGKSAMFGNSRKMKEKGRVCELYHVSPACWARETNVSIENSVTAQPTYMLLFTKSSPMVENCYTLRYWSPRVD